MLKRYSHYLAELVLWTLLAACILNPGFKYVKSIVIKADSITSDNLGNLYVLTGNTLKKYSRQGNLLAEYTRKNIDRFSRIDASDPLKILLFSKTAAEIIRLDNKLAPQGNATSLYNAGIVSPALACNSFDNGCWIWDNSLNELIRINQNGMVDQRTENLANIIAPDAKLSMILEKDFLLYASEPGLGLFVFDRYGTFVKTLPLKDIQSFQVSSEKIMFFSDGEIKNFDTKTMEESSVILPVRSCVNALLEGKNLFIHQPDSISIYLSNNLP